MHENSCTSFVLQHLKVDKVSGRVAIVHAVKTGRSKVHGARPFSFFKKLISSEWQPAASETFYCPVVSLGDTLLDSDTSVTFFHNF